MLVNRVATYIQKEDLLPEQGKVLIALSGGADSVALLHILMDLGYTCEAAHCNFALRGEESDRDEAFVRALCHTLDIPLYVKRFDTHKYASEKHISIEMAARELRYDWFASLRQQLSVPVTAVAHHRDDSVETLLLNLIRGTGLHGLRGIPPRNSSIIRPLLCVTREELIAYLDRVGQPYVTDSSNLADKYTRNKIRLNLLPLLREINPGVDKSLMQTSEYLRQVSLVYDQAIEKAKERIQTPEGIRIGALLQEKAPETVLFEILYPLGFSPEQIRAIFSSLSGQPGRQFTGSRGWRTIKDREMLLLVRTDTGKELAPFRLVTETLFRTPDFVIPRDKHITCIDADKIHAPLEIRKWQPGDKFVPLGMKEKKLISDFLTDLKYSLPRKEQQWLICCGDQIVWVVGERIDDRFRINEKTERIMLLSIEKPIHTKADPVTETQF
ncbi:MAG: tRNA lysidine(34) synthetase TilS [Bacteroides sp.]|nr:tRNA lysidine(34) synthetase TilS [Bacteroides sp.]